MDFGQTAIGIAYELIDKKQATRAASFWIDVETQLNSPTSDLNAGLKYLEKYFPIKLSLPDELKEEKPKQLQQVQSKTPKEEKVKAVNSLIMMNVRRNGLPEVVKKFKCSPEFNRI